MANDEIRDTEEVRICIIDDEKDIIKLAERVFGNHGYKTMGLTDVIGSSMKIRKFNPDLIILDVDMPTIDGANLFHVFKNNLPRVPKVIFFSGIDPEKLEEIALNSNADDYVYKGDGFMKLLSTVNLHLFEMGRRS